MQATSDQLIGLTKLQHVDLSIANLRRDVDGLAQKQAIADIRAKRAAIRHKLGALEDARLDAESRLDSLRDEDAACAHKQSAAQAAIDAAVQDYRAVTARSAELAELAQQRADLAAKIDETQGRLQGIADMKPQASAMLARLEQREEALIADYRREGGLLLRDIAALESERAQLAEAVGPDIMAHYERLSKAKQGVALAHLVEGSCNTCRSRIDPSRVLVLRSEYPLSFCPHCGRLMVVDKRYAG